MRILFTIQFSLLFAGCASIVGDPNAPLIISFSDGSTGHCSLTNKHGDWSTEIPTSNVPTQYFEEDLAHNCITEDGRRVSGWIRTKLKGEKMAASVVFWRLGITDATIDQQSAVVIPVPRAAENAMGETTKVAGEKQGLLASEYLE